MPSCHRRRVPRSGTCWLRAPEGEVVHALLQASRSGSVSAGTLIAGAAVSVVVSTLTAWLTFQLVKKRELAESSGSRSPSSISSRSQSWRRRCRTSFRKRARSSASRRSGTESVVYDRRPSAGRIRSLVRSATSVLGSATSSMTERMWRSIHAGIRRATRAGRSRTTTSYAPPCTCSPTTSRVLRGFGS